MTPPTLPPLKRILAADDDFFTRSLLELALVQVGGFEVCLCADGREAVAQAPAFAPDLILLDAQMPEMDGPAALAALRADPATAAVPVVILTASAGAEHEARYRALGAAAVLAKPIDVATFAATVRARWATLAPGTAGTS